MKRNIRKDNDTGKKESIRNRLRKRISRFMAAAVAVTMLGGHTTAVIAEEASTEYALAGAGSGQDVTVHFSDNENHDINIHVNSETGAEESASLAGLNSETKDETETESSTGIKSLEAGAIATITPADGSDLPQEAEASGEVVTGKEEKTAVRKVEEAGGVEQSTEAEAEAAAVEKTEYQVFDIALDNVDTEQYQDGFKVEVTLPEEVEGKDFKLYHIPEGEEPVEVDMNTVGSVDNETGLEVVSGFDFVTDGFDQFVFQYTQLTTRVMTADGESYIITLSFGPDAEIPLGAELRAHEIEKESKEWSDYITRAMDAVDNVIPDASNRFFDIEIWANGQKIEPRAVVNVNIALENAPIDDQTEVSVVHFEESGPVVMEAETQRMGESMNIDFATSSFSVYGVIASQTAPTSVNDLGGRSFTFNNGGRYATNTVDNTQTTHQLVKNADVSLAATWQFEATDKPGKYYISTIIDQQKKYLNFKYRTSQNAHVELGSEPQEITVSPENNEYVFSASDNRVTYFLNEYYGGVGFAGYSQRNNRDDTMTLSFVTVQPDSQYILVTKYEGQYYVILNDGTLVRTDDPSGDTMFIDNPMMWTYTGDNLYHRAKETGFDGNQLAYDRFYRYLEPDENTALIDEDYENTTGHFEKGGATEYRIDTRPLMDQTKVKYADNKISSIDNPSNYIGVVRDEKGLRIIGKQSADNAAEIYLVSVPAKSALADNDGLVHEKYHTVNHIDISIKGQAAFSVPLAYGTYYYMDDDGVVKTLIVNRDNPVTVDIAQEVPVDREDVKNAEITAFTIKNGVHVPVDNAFYVTGFSGNEHNDTSTNQTRIEGVFKVSDLPPLSDNTSNTAEWKRNSGDPGINRFEYIASDAMMKKRLENKIYYTVSTTKNVSFDFAFNTHKLYSSAEAAQNGATDGVAKGNATVTLSATFDYWDLRNECPPIGWDRNFWRNGGIIYSAGDQTGSGMDFALTTINREEYGVLAMEITKYILDDAGNPITPLNDVENVFHIYRSGSAPSGDVQGKDVDTYKHELDGYDYSGKNYARVHDKTVTVGEGGVGTVYDYDVDQGMIYIEEDTSDKNLPQSLEDVNGKTWTYKKTYIETEYVWRDDGIEYRRHISKEYTDPSEAYNSVPEVLGAYEDINGISRHNGFLEFYVYNVYESKPIDVSVRKNWKHENGLDADAPADARIAVTLGRYHLVEDEDHPINGNLIINHTVSELGSGDKYYASYRVKLGNKILRSGSLDFSSNGSQSLEMRGLNEGTYTLELTESANGYATSPTSTTSITINRDGSTIVNVTTQLKKKNKQDLVSVHIKNRLESYSVEAYQDRTYQFAPGTTLIITIHRPSRAYRSTDFYAKLNNNNFPWPSEGNDTAYTYVDQHYEYTVSNGASQTLDFLHNWGRENFWISGVEPKVSSDQNNGNETSSTTISVSYGQSSPAASTTQSGSQEDSRTPESDVPGMKYVDDDSEWFDAENMPIDKEVILANGLWEDVVTGLPAVDEKGYKYLYYIKSVEEEGVPEETQVEIKTNGGYVLTSDGETVLEVTNTVPNVPPQILLKKVDDNGNPLSGAVFSVTEDGTNNTIGLTAVDTAGTVFKTDELQFGTYTVQETPPVNYKGITSSFKFSVTEEGNIIAPSSGTTLPDGVSYSTDTFTFTVENTPDGRLKLIKRWLDINGNDTTPGTDSVTLKLVQMVRNQLPMRVLRVKIHWVDTPKRDGNGNYPVMMLDQAFVGRGTASFTWNWNHYNGNGTDIITVTGGPEGTRVEQIGTVSQRVYEKGQWITKEKPKFRLTIPYGENAIDTVDVLVNNHGYYPFEYSDQAQNGSISNIHWDENVNEGEGYTATGGTKTVTLNAGNNWSQEFTYSGMGMLQDNSTTLPAQYENGRECRYVIVENSVPEGFTVSYADTNELGLGNGSDGTITAYNRRTTTDLKLIKIDKLNRTTRLNGAEFELYQIDPDKRGGERLSNNPVDRVETGGTDGSGNPLGEAVFSGLSLGYYEIKEVKAPDLYCLKEGGESYYIKVTTNGVFAIMKDESKYPDRWAVRSNDSHIVVNDPASMQAGITTLTVSNTPYTGIKIKKVDWTTLTKDRQSDENTKYLNGAQFTLQKWDEDKRKYVNYSPAALQGEAYVNPVPVRNNEAFFDKLEPGEYVIKETAVPAGYMKLQTNDIFFKVEYGSGGTQTITWYNAGVSDRNDSSVISTDTQSINETIQVTFTPSPDGSHPATFVVGNTPGAILPSTGGTGTRFIYILGAGLILLAGALLLLRRRRIN